MTPAQRRGGLTLPFENSPYPWTLRLVALNVIFFLLHVFFMRGEDSILRDLLILHPHYFFRGAIWQLVTYMFMHSTALSSFIGIPIPAHLAFNMLLLWMMGREVELTLGGAAFLRLYFLAGIVAGICALFTGSPTLGASGAVLGILAVFGHLFPDRMILVFFFIPMKVRYFIWMVAALDLFGAIAANDNIAHMAHIGGLFTGIIMMKTGWYKKRYLDLGEWRRRRGFEDQKRVKQRVDEILDKVSKQGIQSLSQQERDFLERVRKGL
jgi:membrane associated rhomboid family serine protease